MDKILLVDDSNLVREVFTHVFIEEGYRVAAVIPSENVPEVLDAQRPDLVILGVGNRWKDWRQILVRVRERAYDLPVILWSDSRELRYDPACVAADYFVLKSSCTDELMDRIERSLQGNHNPTQAGGPTLHDHRAANGLACS